MFHKATAVLSTAAIFSGILTPRGMTAEQSQKKAQPFGIGTRGGLGGNVLRVTNLNEQGPGSLREAVETKGPRIVVFEVGGVVDLDKKRLLIREPFLTIAGQTAPSPGITLIKAGVMIKTHDVLLQHLAIRPGTPKDVNPKGWATDALTTSAHREARGKVYNVVIDHCSATWGSDEGMSVSGPRNARGDETTHDVTFRHCIIAEGLWNATHRKGRHSRGSLVMDGCRRIAFVGNLFAHNNQRHPLFKGGSSGLLLNNLIVNPGNRCIQMTSNGHGKHLGAPVTTVIGNVMAPGRNTRTGLFNGIGDMYARDNLILKKDGQPAKVKTYGKTRKLWHASLSARPSAKVREHVLLNAGARPADRDSIDQRIVRQCREGKGRIIDSQDDVGGYPQYEMTRRKLNIPENNIAQWLEQMAKRIEPAAAPTTAKSDAN